MLIVTQLLLLMLLALLLAYHKQPRNIWLLTFASVLVFITLVKSLPWILLFPLWAIAIGFAILLNINSYRLRFFTKPIMKWLKSSIPPISETERIAIESGNVWWEAELFKGQPDWRKLRELAQPQLTTAEKSFIDNQVQTLCAMLDNWQITQQDKDLPPQAWDYIKKQGFWGMVIPKQYGGLGFSPLAHSTIVSIIGTRSYTAAVTTMVPNSLGPGELIIRYGTEQQKKYYLPKLANGEETPCFALTGTESGSDAANMRDIGIICKGEFNGQQVMGMRISLDKRYITLAPVATLIGVAFKLYDPDSLLGKEKNLGITLALIPSNTPGLETGKRHMPLCSPFMNGPVRADNMFIPLDYVIGGQKMLGHGWRMLMECLSIGRSISLPAISSGAASLATWSTGAYAAIRKQFNLPISKFPGVWMQLGRMTAFSYMLKATRLLTLTAVYDDGKPSVASAIAKYHSTEMARIILNDAMDIHAGHAIQDGKNNYLATLYQSWPVNITVEGANILTRTLIIFGQGAIRCHPYLLKELTILQNEKDEFKLEKFDETLLQHMDYSFGNIAHSVVYGLTGGRFIHIEHNDATTYYYQQLTRMSTAFSVITDMALLRLGGQLKRLENLSARLGDALSHLYIASATLKYYQKHADIGDDIAFLQWSCQYCLFQIQNALIDFLDNFPYPYLAKLLRVMVFPLGKPYKMPSDQLTQQLAEHVTQPSAIRDRMANLCYISNDKTEALTILQAAFNSLHNIKEVMHKFDAAIRNEQISQQLDKQQQIKKAQQLNILTEKEAKQLLEFEVLRSKVVAVDEF